MRRLLFLLALAALPFAGHAAPPGLDGLDRAPQVRLSPAAVRSLLTAHQHEPLRFAVGTALAVDHTSGAWDEPQAGWSRWRLRIASDAARALSFEMRDLQLPPGAELWVCGSDGHDRQGPLAVGDAGSTWTPLVRGNEAVIEVQLPSTRRADFHVGGVQAFHAYRDIGSAVSAQSFPTSPDGDTGNGASGDCNIDVACPDGNNWRDEIRATVLLTVGGSALCSATLINNALQDDRPLLLTANHCGISTRNVASTIAYFNVQRSACGGGSVGTVTQNVRARSLLASSSPSTDTDYALIELANKPPPSFNVHYAGLDVSGTVPTSGVGIHHPAGDDKKISTFTMPAASSANVCIGTRCGTLGDGFQVDAWAVVWTRGTTEAGSSGSGLWNPAGRVVGTLSGGSGQCPSSTGNNGGVDYYARLDRAWTAASAGSGLTLKSLLDPQDSGCLQFAGKNPGSATALSCRSGPPPVDAGGNESGASGSGGGGGGFGLGYGLVPMLLAGLLRRRQRRFAAQSASAGPPQRPRAQPSPAGQRACSGTDQA